ncbi:disease resistance protein RGA2-like [Papaver somniferum]|uniref:disease resistance protein RGA2-like n=1 Tax=Papaver somniferum TaxID=3469 RepID=UPI000E6FF03B|nr:disease resistance protein RGA2-like [Papaver somniferum]
MGLHLLGFIDDVKCEVGFKGNHEKINLILVVKLKSNSCPANRNQVNQLNLMVVKLNLLVVKEKEATLTDWGISISFWGILIFRLTAGAFSQSWSPFRGILPLDPNTKGARVINIVVIGGIGKTTVAQSVYDHDKVKSHFDNCARGILEALSSSSPLDDNDADFNYVANSHGADMLPLLTHLSNRIKQNKFLLVLDDVWNEDIRDWLALKSLLVGAPGSSILSLTRNKMAAYLMSTTTLHELKPLSKESAWKLFCQSAYGKKDDVADTLKPFEDIGRIVLQRCNGVPLALKCLGGLLRAKTSRHEWEDVMESDKWELLEMEPILSALHFSYYSLPRCLKLGFSYTALFPKDRIINKSTLIKLWMAEGFLGSSATKDRDPELVGQDYFQ